MIRRRHAFTLTELMIALSIFAGVSAAATFLLATTAHTQSFVRESASDASEVELAVERIVGNVRSATSLTSTSTSLHITSPPSALVAGDTFTITYEFSNGNLLETYTTNSNGQIYSTTALVHGASQFLVTPLGGNTKAVQITLITESTSRYFVVFGRNL